MWKISYENIMSCIDSEINCLAICPDQYSKNHLVSKFASLFDFAKRDREDTFTFEGCKTKKIHTCKFIVLGNITYSTTGWRGIILIHPDISEYDIPIDTATSINVTNERYANGLNE